jgi:seryl-tRNA synthetase
MNTHETPAAKATAELSDIDRARLAFRQELFDADILVPTGVNGVYGRSAAFESVVNGIADSVNRCASDDNAVSYRFPPVVTRANYERSDHLRSFPQLVGSVHSFYGNDREHAAIMKKFDARDDWSEDFPHTDVMLCPAACYPIYPTLRGRLAPGGRVIETQTYVFRHEPSVDPMRMQFFRQHEHIRIGAPEEVLAWRNTWFERAQELLTLWQIPFLAEVASDPFFGRGGKMMAKSQVEQALKFEMNVPIMGPEHPTACVSLNLHQDHFAHTFEIETADGQHAHTSCIGFGLERLTLGLFRFHGLNLDAWPTAVKRELLGR